MSFAEAFTSRSFPADAIAADASNRFHPQEATWEGTFRTDRSFSGGGVLIFHHGDGGSSSRRDSPLKHELRQYSEEEWNAMYPHIKRLYMAERRNLHEVVQLMRREHGFNATARMYKIRLAKWGLFKNNSRKRIAPKTKVKTKGGQGGAEDVDVDVDATADADAGPAGPPPRVEPGDTRSSSSRIRSKNSSQGRIKRADTSSINAEPTLELIVAKVPRRVPDTPRDLRAYSAFAKVRAWGPREDVGLESFLRSLSQGQGDLSTIADDFASTEMYRSFGLASALWGRGQGRLAGKAIRRAFLLAEEAVASADAMLVWNVVDVVYEMAHWGQTHLLRLFLDHVERMAVCRGVPHHPIRTIVRSLAGSNNNNNDDDDDDDGDLYDLAERVWKCHLDQLRVLLKAEEDKVRGFIESVSSTEAKLGYGDDGRPSNGLIAKGIGEWIRTAELLRRPIRPEHPYYPEPGQERWETRIWYITVASFMTWSTAQDNGSSSSRTTAKCAKMTNTTTTTAAIRHSLGSPGHMRDRTSSPPPPPPPSSTPSPSPPATSNKLAGVYPDIYVLKARLRALVEAEELEKAEELARTVLHVTDATRNSDGLRAIVARWAFEDLLERAGKMDEAQAVRKENLRRIQNFLADIPDHLP